MLSGFSDFYFFFLRPSGSVGFYHLPPRNAWPQPAAIIWLDLFPLFFIHDPQGSVSFQQGRACFTLKHRASAASVRCNLVLSLLSAVAFLFSRFTDMFTCIIILITLHTAVLVKAVFFRLLRWLHVHALIKV